MTDLLNSSFSVLPQVRWGEADPKDRGPLICMDHKGKPGNVIGAFGGQYGLYRALAHASNLIPNDFTPTYKNPRLRFNIPQRPSWSGDNAICTFDPFGHLVPALYPELIAQGVNVRPTIAITTTTLDLPEIHTALRHNWLQADGKIVDKETGFINVTKIAIEPVWYLPGIANYIGADEAKLREAIYFGNGGGPEAIKDSRMNVYLPSFGESTIYILGDLEKVGQQGVTHAVRVHDKCGSSDTHGATICSCRPALMWGYEEGARIAQKGGVVVIVYTEAEGRGHGVVPKNWVYEARLAGEDRPEDYFDETVLVTGIADMRQQRFPADALRWLGFGPDVPIDILMSGSYHKEGGITAAGIDIASRRPLPPHRLPAGVADTEYAAKLADGYNYAPRPKLGVPPR